MSLVSVITLPRVLDRFHTSQVEHSREKLSRRGSCTFIYGGGKTRFAFFVNIIKLANVFHHFTLVQYTRGGLGVTRKKMATNQLTLETKNEQIHRAIHYIGGTTHHASHKVCLVSFYT